MQVKYCKETMNILWKYNCTNHIIKHVNENRNTTQFI